MAYYNRRTLLLNTLRTIAKSSEINKTEIIIVDDGSEVHERVEHIVDLFDFPIKVIRIEPEDKWYNNPCVPYNMGIKKATGEIIVLQNPEVLHTGDILADISKRIDDNNYLVYGVYCINDVLTERINNTNWGSATLFTDIQNIIKPTNNRAAYTANDCGWYNHSVLRPSALHFLSAISKPIMDKLGGFDERYAMGVDRDDNEFIYRIKRNNVNIKIVDTPYAIHQNHPKVAYNRPNVEQLRQLNVDLFKNVTEKETMWAPFNVDSIKVSVIIPFYNRINWTIEAVNSVLNQTHKNTEIILVNDCSTDDISDVYNLAKNNGNIRITSLQKNYGAGEARNIGIQYATGNYISFLDSDDKYLPHKLEKQLKFMIQEDYDASHMSYYLSRNNEITKVNSGEFDVTFPNVIGECSIATPSFMVKRKFLTEHNITFPTYRTSQDTCFFIKVAQHTDIKGINLHLVNVKSHMARTFTQPEKALTGLSNVLHFVTHDPELITENSAILNLCHGIKIAALQYANKVENLADVNDLQLQINALNAEKNSVEEELRQTQKELTMQIKNASAKETEVKNIQERQRAEFMAKQTGNNTKPDDTLTAINPKHPKARFERKPI